MSFALAFYATNNFKVIKIESLEIIQYSFVNSLINIEGKKDFFVHFYLFIYSTKK
jgi:hypothetical protein